MKRGSEGAGEFPGGISDELLQAWMDGEVGEDAARIEAYVENNSEAQERIEELTRAGTMLRELVDGALGPVDPLAGMAAIRERIREADEGRLRHRIIAWWNDVWMFNRGAVLGVAFAAVAGVVAAPALMWLLAEDGSGAYGNSYENAPIAEQLDEDPGLYAPAGVSIESLDVGGNRSARVLDSGETTLIWVGTDDSEEWDGWDDEDVDGSEEP